MPHKLLFDTDIGSDIDDAVALAWLLASPECDLVGITTVSGQPEIRAKLASALRQVAGTDVPIVPGSEQPLSVEPRQRIAQQADSLYRWNHEESFAESDAVEFMADTIRREPGEITLLAVGPMTNVAKLFVQHPETAHQLKRIVLMLGRFGTEQIGQRPAEWNAYCDPDAAQVVLNTKTNGTLVHGLDVTTKVRMDASEVRSRFSAPLLVPVLDMAEEWFSRRPIITFHDPLAAVATVHPDLCRYVRGTSTVEVGNGDSQGVTSWAADSNGAIDVGFEVDVDRFFDLYFGQFAE